MNLFGDKAQGGVAGATPAVGASPAVPQASAPATSATPTFPDPVAPLPAESGMAPSPAVPLDPVATPAPAVAPTPAIELPSVPAAQPSAPAASNADMSDAMQESILDKTLARVAEVMTEEDMREFTRIDREDPTGNAGKYFILTRVPQFERILQEEIEFAQKEHQATA